MLDRRLGYSLVGPRLAFGALAIASGVSRFHAAHGEFDKLQQDRSGRAERLPGSAPCSVVGRILKPDAP